MDPNRETLNSEDRDNWRWKVKAWTAVVLDLWWVAALFMVVVVLAVKSLV